MGYASLRLVIRAQDKKVQFDSVSTYIHVYISFSHILSVLCLELNSWQ